MLTPEKAPVCIIGAGFAGLAAMRELQDQGEPFIAFEHQDRTGGLWNYKHTGWPTFPSYSEAVANPIYRKLRANVPKDTMSFADFPFDESVPEFPNLHHTHVLDYVQRFAKANNLDQAIEFQTTVTCVSWDDDVGLWQVHSLCKGVKQQRSFKAVVVATGHYGYPLIPQFPGLESFPGHVIHSCQFDDAADFKDKRVLVIGGSVSAGQIAELLFSSSLCTSVQLSSRKRDAFGFDFTVGRAEALGVPNFGALEALLANGAARFTNGSEIGVDVVISATGYAYRFPFLDPDSLDLLENDSRSLKHLYKGLWYAPRPSLTFMGMHNNVIGIAPLLEHQARAVVAVIQGRTMLPTRHVMEENTMDLRVSLGFQTGAYCKSLAMLSGTNCTFTGASNMQEALVAMKAKVGDALLARL